VYSSWDGAFDTASIVKVDILATLLLQAQDASRRLTAAERSYATKMIGHSDNASATALWQGSGWGCRLDLDAANKRFRLTAALGGDGGPCGLTQTTTGGPTPPAPASVGEGSRLSPASRTYVQGLMKQVEPDQQWGVSTAAQPNSWG
jgi:hypothetical protein